MTTTFLADGSGSTLARSIAALILPIPGWVAFALWRGYSVIVVLVFAIVLGGLLLWAISARGAWKQVTVGPEALTLQRPGASDVVVQRGSVLKLELRDRVVVVKWRATHKDRVELLAKERFSTSTWNSLRETLERWVEQ